MTDQMTTDPHQATTAAALDALKRKQGRRATWSKIAGGLLVLFFGIRAAVALFGSHTMTCTSDDAITTLTSSINEKLAQDKPGVTVAKINNPTQLTRKDPLSTCSAQLALSDQSTHDLSYQVNKDRVEWSTTF